MYINYQEKSMERGTLFLWFNIFFLSASSDLVQSVPEEDDFVQTRRHLFLVSPPVPENISPFLFGHAGDRPIVSRSAVILLALPPFPRITLFLSLSKVKLFRALNALPLWGLDWSAFSVLFASDTARYLLLCWWSREFGRAHTHYTDRQTHTLYTNTQAHTRTQGRTHTHTHTHN